MNLDLLSSLNKENIELNYDNKEKQLGQVFTPKWVVELMLDKIGYNEDILDKKILEPSCGDGAFLTSIVERYIKHAIDKKLNISQIKNGLENNICGIEIDNVFYTKCIDNLNDITAKYDIFNINWNIINSDSLKYLFKDKFDFIIGNPPYVRVHNLDLLTRNFLKTNYLFCDNGTTDLYYAFYEKAITDIKDNGKIAFITPNSFMRNNSAKNLRNYIINNNLLEELINFEEYQVFESASVYSAIMILSKNNINANYYNFVNNHLNFIKSIQLNNYKNKLWNFNDIKELTFTNNFILQNTQHSIKVQNGFATLCDKLYITNNIEELDDNYILFNGEKIEKDITKLIVKANRYNGEKIKTRIIFPYHTLNGKTYQIISSNDMKDKFPFCYEYFIKNKNLFLNRDIDPNWKEWYQYGRSQSIQSIHNKKIVINNVVKDAIRLFELNENVMVYSGLYIIADNIDYIKQRLLSEDFIKYIKVVGKDMRGGYKSFNSKILSNFLNMEVYYG